MVAIASGGSPHEHSIYALSSAVSHILLLMPLNMAHTPGGSPCVKNIFTYISEVDEEDIQEDTRLSLCASSTVFGG